MIMDMLKKIMTTDILKNIIILFGLLIFLFIAVNILTTIYTYINKRIRTGNILEGFKCKGYKEYNETGENAAVCYNCDYKPGCKGIECSQCCEDQKDISLYHIM